MRQRTKSGMAFRRFRACTVILCCLVHACRDIKLEILFVHADGSLKLGDFGYGTLKAAQASQRTTSVVGTSEYLGMPLGRLQLPAPPSACSCSCSLLPLNASATNVDLSCDA